MIFTVSDRYKNIFFVSVDSNKGVRYTYQCNNGVSMMNEIREIAELLAKMDSADEIFAFLKEMLTESELSVLSKRWRILKLLSEGKTQRDIAKELSVSLCKVTRGSKICKSKNAIVNKLINGDYDEQQKYKQKQYSAIV